MSIETNSKHFCPWAALLIGLSFAASGTTPTPFLTGQLWAATRPETTIPSAAIPDDVQLVNADTDPTLRIPVAHYAVLRLGIAGVLSGSLGWLEINGNTVRYLAAMRAGRLGEKDIGFEYSRTEITGLKLDSHGTSFQVRGDHRKMAEFKAQRAEHYFAYLAPNHWNAPPSSSVVQTDGDYTALIVRALENFSGVAVEIKAKQQAVAPPPAVVRPAAAPALKPEPPPSPPEVVLVAPSGASENGTVQANESPLAIRGVAMDNSGLPTVTVNGAPAALRPKDAHAVEFWSEPLPLQPGDNPVQIIASSSAHVEAKLAFTIHYAPKTAPVNSKALDKADIISLLAGGVPASRVAQILKDRGIKFVPTADDLNVIRSAGGTDDLIEAIQKAAPRP
jgi:hypothetical protein